MNGRRQDEVGAVAVIVAFSTVLLFILAALVVDLGLARDTRRESQNAADASALAAANVLFPSGTCTVPAGGAPPCFADAVAAAKSYAEENYGVDASDWALCPTPPSGYAAFDATAKCVSFDALTSAVTKVWMVMPTRDVQTSFGSVAGTDHVTIHGAARAVISNGVTTTCGLCFLGSVDSGNADYTVEGGAIAVSGNSDLGATGHMTGTSVSVGGTFNANDGYSPKPVVDIDPFTDPLTALALPVGKAGLTTKTQPCQTAGKKKNDPVVPGQGPGVYGDVAITGTCNLEPGLYIITGQWSLKNGDLLNNKAGGVTLYFTCGNTTTVRACNGSGEPGGQLFGKNGDMDLTARTTNPVAGYAIVYDRHNTSSVQLQGNGLARVDGGIYAASAALEFNGNSCFVINHGPVVAQTVIKANGTKSCVKVTSAQDTTLSKKPTAIALDR